MRFDGEEERLPDLFARGARLFPPFKAALNDILPREVVLP